MGFRHIIYGYTGLIFGSQFAGGVYGYYKNESIEEYANKGLMFGLKAPFLIPVMISMATVKLVKWSESYLDKN